LAVKAVCWWLTPVIPAAQEAEIRRIAVLSQPRQIVLESLSQKNPSQKRGLVEWLKVKALSSNPDTEKQKKRLAVKSGVLEPFFPGVRGLPGGLLLEGEGESAFWSRGRRSSSPSKLCC
jgi:hypothetical protein